MAEKRTINIDINNNADETAKDFDTLNKSIDQTTKSTKNLDDTFEEVYGDLQPLTSRMGEAEDRLYELSLAGDTTSKEFQELLTKVGQYRKVQMDTDLAVDAAATTLGQKLGGALGGATAGFSLAQGSMALFGSESEVLEKSLLKVQAALAIQQGVEGIRQAIPSIKQLGMAASTAFKAMSAGAKAFAVTGIGLILTGLAMVIAKTQEVNENEEELEEERKQRQESEINRQVELTTAYAGMFAKSMAFNQALLNLAKEGTESEQERFELEQENRRKNIISLQYDVGQYQEAQRVRGISFEEAERLRNLEFEAGNRIQILNTNIATEELKNNKRKIQSYKDYASLRLSIARQIEDLENSLLEDGIDKELEINRVNFERLKADAKGNAQEKIKLRALYTRQEEEAVQDIKDNYQKIADDKQKVIDDKEESEAIALSDKLAEIKEANAALFRTEQENELLAVERKYDLLKAMAQGNAEALEDINIARLNAENDINLQYANQAAADQKALDDKTLAEKQELQALILQGAKDTFTTISNLAQLFAGESEESQRKAFKIQKAANIANATIDTYASAVAAFRSLSGVPIVGVPLGIAAAAAAVTAGMLNVKSIGQQEFGGSGGAEPDVPSFDAGAAQAPSFNVVGDSGINQLASLQQQPVQAFVVSGEVTTSQALDRNRVENATL